jgi:hypothetical protein
MFEYHKSGSIVIAELLDEKYLISRVQDVLDLLGNMGEVNCTRLIIREENLSADFFRLYSGLAGEILQKFSNYHCRLAVIGDFSKYKSKSLQDFIRESNKGNMIFFVDNLNTALSVLLRD